jgi:hypothetical protein
MAITLDGTTGIAGIDGSAGTPAVQGADSNTGVFFPAADTVAVATGGAEKMRITDTGIVGIGTSSPTAGYLLDVRGQIIIGDGGGNADINFNASNVGRFLVAGTERVRIDSNGNLLVGKTSSTGSRFEVERTDNDNAIADFKTNNASGDVFIRSSGGFVRLRATGTNELAFFSASTERARITSDGRFYVNQTAGNGNTLQRIGVTYDGATEWAFAIKTTAASGAAISFQNSSGTQVGVINQSNTGTSYVTSSDYRLKQNITPMTGALGKIAMLNPVTYNWKIDGSDGQGFIAHELQEVIPDCVIGEKDAVDAEGNPQYQGVDTSFLVATLVKAVQELTARISALENTQ